MHDSKQKVRIQWTHQLGVGEVIYSPQSPLTMWPRPPVNTAACPVWHLSCVPNNESLRSSPTVCAHADPKSPFGTVISMLSWALKNQKSTGGSPQLRVQTDHSRLKSLSENVACTDLPVQALDREQNMLLWRVSGLPCSGKLCFKC